MEAHVEADFKVKKLFQTYISNDNNHSFSLFCKAKAAKLL